MTEERLRDYHREKAAEQRKMWVDLQCKPMSVNIPEPYHLWLRGMAAIMQADHILNRVRAGDDEVMSVIANRRPKYMVMHEDIDVLQGRSEEMDEQCQYMRSVLMSARNHKAKGTEMLTVGDAGMYHFAIEWCLVCYLKGYYDLALYQLNGGVVPAVTKLDLDALEEYTPNVL